MSIDRLQEKIRKYKNPSVVNFDVMPEHIPNRLLREEGSFLRGYGRFCMETMDALRSVVPAVRFSFSALALYGTDGLCTLARLLDYARKLGFYIFLDIPDALSAQRAEANAREVFKEGSLWICDGLILSSYIGSDGIKPYAQRVAGADKDLFIVVRSANKSAAELQDLITGSRHSHQAQADTASRLGKPMIGQTGYSKIAAIGPATSASILSSLRAKYPHIFLFVDGYDYANANAKICSSAFDQFGHGAIVCASDSVFAEWCQEEQDNEDFAALAVRAAERMKKNLTKYVTIL